MEEPMLHVLIVDDEPTYRLVLTQTLKTYGYTTEACETGDAAIDLLNKNNLIIIFPPSIIIMKKSSPCRQYAGRACRNHYHCQI